MDHVRTPAGVARYHEPIGSPIVRHSRLKEVLKGHNVKGLGLNSGTPTTPINTKGDVMLAARLIAQGKHVRLNRVDQVGTLLSDLLKLSGEAKRKHETLDLCRVSIPKTNLFCAHNKGIDRINMPQLAGKPRPGTKAAALAEPGKEVDLTKEFEAALRSHGVKVTDTSLPAASFKATQDQLVGDKVAGIEKFMETAPKDSGIFEPIFVTRDHYIIDGHHRWAAMVGLDAKDGVLGNYPMKVRMVDMEIGEALAAARAFADDWGIGSEGVTHTGPTVASFAGKSLSKVHLKEVDLAFNPAEHRDSHGRWTKGPSLADIEKAIGGTTFKTAPPRTAPPAVAADALLKRREGFRALTQQALLEDLNNDVSDYEFNSALGGETSGLEAKIKQTLKDHPELLNTEKGQALLKNHPRLTGKPPTYAQASDDNYWAEMDPQGELPGDGPSVHVEHEAQITSEFWHDTLPEDAPDEEHFALSLWEAYQNPNLYGSINTMLRTGKRTPDSNATVEEMRHYVDVMFDKAGTTTKKPIRLYRALHSSNQTEATGIPNWAETLKPGSTFTDKGLMSCTAHGKFAQGWLALDPKGAEVDAEDPSDVVLELRVPKGQRIVGGSKQFIETMLPPGTSIKVISAEKRTADAPVNPLGATPEDPFTYTHVVAEVLPK